MREVQRTSTCSRLTDRPFDQLVHYVVHPDNKVIRDERMGGWRCICSPWEIGLLFLGIEPHREADGVQDIDEQIKHDGTYDGPPICL